MTTSEMATFSMKKVECPKVNGKFEEKMIAKLLKAAEDLTEHLSTTGVMLQRDDPTNKESGQPYASGQNAFLNEMKFKLGASKADQSTINEL